MKTRDRWPDFLRATALLVIVAYHISFAHGQSAIGTALSFLPRMGMLFALGGMFIVGAMDRNWEQAIGQRMKRLLLPVWALALVVIPAMYIHGWQVDHLYTTQIHSYEYKLIFWFFPVIVPPADTMGIWWAITLWFMVTYLWLVMLTPVLLGLFRRWPMPTLLVPLALTFLWNYTTIDEHLGQFAFSLRYVCAYASAWMVGFAARDGKLGRFRVREVLVFGGFFMAAGTAWILTHRVPGRSIDLKSNLVAESLYAFGSAVILLRFSPKLMWTYRWGVRHVLAVINGRAMTIYIWHQVVLSVLAVQILWRFDSPLPGGITTYIATWILLMVPILALGWLEDVAARRKPQLLPKPPAPPQQRRAVQRPTTPTKTTVEVNA